MIDLMIKRFALIVFLWFFVACTPNAIVPTPEVEGKPTVIATAVAQPTESFTLDPTAVPTVPPTLPPTSTPSPEIVNSLISPNELWIATAEGGVFGSTEKMILRVKNLADGREWIAESAEKTNLSFNIPPDPIHWSADSTYLYFTHRSFNDGCGPELDGIDLFRVNVVTGKVVEVVERGSWFAFAPDGEHVAYMWRNEIFIQNLATGVQQAVALSITNEFEEVFLSYLAWSPDSQSVAVLAGINICFALPNSASSIVVVDATSLLQKTILDEDPAIVFINEWPEINTLIVTLSEGGQSEIVQFKIDTGEFLPLGTAVPTLR